MAAQAVGQPVNKRRFRPDHDQADILRSAEVRNRAVVGRIKANQFRLFTDSRIAGGSVEFRACGGLRQLPG